MKNLVTSGFEDFGHPASKPIERYVPRTEAIEFTKHDQTYVKPRKAHRRRGQVVVRYFK